MQKFIETTGKTEDAAIAAALEQLGLSREEVSVEVLDLAKPGFLGIGGTPARVKVTYEAPDEPEEAPAPIVEEAPAGEKADEEADSVEYTTMGAAFAENEESAAPAPADDGKAAKIKEFLTGRSSGQRRCRRQLSGGAGGGESGGRHRPPGRDFGRHSAVDRLHR